MFLIALSHSVAGSERRPRSPQEPKIGYNLPPRVSGSGIERRKRQTIQGALDLNFKVWNNWDNTQLEGPFDNLRGTLRCFIDD